jgi:hypothetical protein
MPCFNSGSCKSSGKNFQCECKPGFYGLYCEADLRRCTSSPCPKGCECIEQLMNMSYTCKCDSHKIMTSQPDPSKYHSSNSAFAFQNLTPSHTLLAYYSIDPPLSSNIQQSKYSTFSITDKKNGNKYNYIKMLAKTKQHNIEFSTTKSKFVDDKNNFLNEQLNNSSASSFDQSSQFYLDENSSSYQQEKMKITVLGENESPNRRPCIDYNPCRHGTCKLSNSSADFTCECTVGYMGPFCDLIRHPW